MLEVVADLFLTHDIGYLSRCAKEIEVFPNRVTATKSVVVERILIFVELVAKAIIGILKIDSVVNFSKQRKTELRRNVDLRIVVFGL